MQNIIFALASFLTAAFAFGFGAVKLFKKKKPMYLKLLVCAAGCFALQQLSCAVNIWCGVTAALAFTVFLSWKDKDLFCAVMWLVMLIPALPASYLNLKHILLPMDPFEFLRATKPCNLAALLFLPSRRLIGFLQQNTLLSVKVRS